MTNQAKYPDPISQNIKPKNSPEVKEKRAFVVTRVERR